MRFQSYFNTALQLINAYDGSVPLVHYLKQYFTQHKKHGSKDRKYIAHLCYCYYRLGHALKAIPVDEQLKAALFICNESIEDWAILFSEELLDNHAPLLSDRIQFIQSKYAFNIQDIFPWQTALSNGVDGLAFAASHLIQPDLFLRVRPGKKNTVLQKLQQHDILFSDVDAHCIALANTTKIDTAIALNKDTVVQDYSSQKISRFLEIVKGDTGNLSKPLKVWDCCAASGGKAILAYDVLNNIELTVSDIRPSIIHNLQQRFKDAGITKYQSLVADLSLTPSALKLAAFDLVICDAPCTGSGTWGRTPEQLYFFQQEKADRYAALQRKIIHSAIPHIKPGGYFLYITCSVFNKENEEAVDIIQQQYGLALTAKEVLTGYDKKADTMFAALFKK